MQYYALIVTFPTTDEEHSETGVIAKDTEIFIVCQRHHEMVTESWKRYIESIGGILVDKVSCLSTECCCCGMDDVYAQPPGYQTHPVRPHSCYMH
jgi:hypothetical protein